MNNNNLVHLNGFLLENFKFSHSFNGENFYGSKMHLVRLSGVCDDIPIIVSDKQIDVLRDWRDEFFDIHGEYRTRMVEGHTHLYVFAKNIIPTDTNENANHIDLRGYICKKPICRKTPAGREISDIILKVHRNYRKFDYIPCICWGRNAHIAENLPEGALVKISGRIQGRIYIKKVSEDYSEQRTAYEVSISQMEVVESEECKDQVTDAE